MNKDQIKGRVEEAKGKTKEVAGNVTGNRTLEVKGKVQKTFGKTQAGYGNVKDNLKKGR